MREAIVWEQSDALWKKPDNAAIVERKDILLLAYLLFPDIQEMKMKIYGMNFYEMAEANEEKTFF